MSAHGSVEVEHARIKDGLMENAEIKVERETETVWTGCHCGHPGAGCYCQGEVRFTGRTRIVAKSEWRGEWQ